MTGSSASMVGDKVYPSRWASLRLAAPVAIALMLLASVLIALRIEQVLLDFAQSRALRTAGQLADRIEAGFRFGLTPADQSQLPQWLQRLREQDASLAAVRVLDDSGKALAEAGDPSAFAGLNPFWTRQLLGKAQQAPANTLGRSSGDIAYAGVPALDATAGRAAVVWLAHDRAELRRTALQVLAGLAPWTAALALLLVLALAQATAAWTAASHGRLDAARQALGPGAADADPSAAAGLLAQVEARRSSEAAWALAALAITLGCMGALAWKSREIARPLVMAQIDESERAVLSLAQSHIERALALGVPSDGLVGLDELFQAQLKPAPEIAFLALQRTDGTVTALAEGEGAGKADAQALRRGLATGAPDPAYRAVARPLEGAAAPAGRLVVGTPVDYVDGRLRTVLFDLVFALVVSLVLARELLGRVWERSQLKTCIAFETAWRDLRRRLAQAGGAGAWKAWVARARDTANRFSQEIAGKAKRSPLGRLGRELVRIRFVVFLMALSDELLRPFFAVFAAEARPLPVDVSPTLQAGLPVAAFMVMLTLAQPLGPWITSRVPVGRALLASLAAGAAISVATAFSHDSASLMLLRAGSGACYGLLMILAQTHIVRITDASQRARGLVEVPGAIVAAGVCGPALGGLLVERLGTTAGFIAAALCLAVAAVAAMRIAPAPADARATLPTLGGWHGMAAVMRHPRVMAVMWCVAVPARLVAAAVLVVVAPLYLNELGESSSVSGRVQLLYFLAFMATAPWVARWSDIHRSRRPWLVWGSVLSAASCAALPLVGGVAGAAACCALLGVAQAMLSAPQLALVTETFDRNPRATQVAGATPEQALAAFRFIERFGSILAPFAAALAVSRFGLAGAVGAIGLVLLAGAAGIAAALWNFETGKKHAPA